ncbi:MAG: hypothetical protein ACETVX_04500 [bacterium]
MNRSGFYSGLALICLIFCIGQSQWLETTIYVPDSLCGIRYLLPFETYYSLKVFDNTGRLVRILKEAIGEKGSCLTTWDKKSPDNRKVSTRIYFIRLQTSSATLIKQVVVLE